MGTIPIVLELKKLAECAADMEAALLALPNKVIDGVSVNATAWTTTASLNADGGVSFLVYFTGTSVSGPQNLLSSVTEETAADYNNYECGRRGKCDYDSGLCDCFEGYTGYKCQVQTALI